MVSVVRGGVILDGLGAVVCGVLGDVGLAVEMWAVDCLSVSCVRRGG